MSMRVQIPMRAAAIRARPITPARSPILRRKCACGGSGGECAECKREKLQRNAGGLGLETAPPIVHEVLQSPGQPLDSATRAFFEPRFGHDFSKVRLHADAKAAESAQAVSALAYTVGNDIVFARRSSVPGTGEDARILAHELTHVLQQSGAAESRAGLRVGSIDSPSEREANQASSAVLSNQFGAPPVHSATSALQRQPTKTAPQTTAGTQADPVWGSKKWPGEENEWNTNYGQAIQGIANNKDLNPEQVDRLAAMVADDSMLLFHHQGKQMWCAMNATGDQRTKSELNMALVHGVGSKGVWGDTFRNALQSTTANVNGPHTAKEAVQRAGDIADQTARRMLSNAAWQLYMNCRIARDVAEALDEVPGVSGSPQPPPKATVAPAR
jgi:hypothetical protein